VRKSGAEGIAGDENQACVGRVHLEDQEDRAGNGQGSDEPGGDDGCVAGGEDAPTDENDGQPKNQNDHEWFWDLCGRLFEHQPAGLCER